MFALPIGNRRAGQYSVELINAFTLKRKILKHTLALGLTAGIERLWTAERDGLLAEVCGIPEAGLLDAMETVVQQPIGSVGMAWPWPPRVDAGRLYLTLFAPEGEPIGFIKFAIGEDQGCLIDQEADMLCVVQQCLPDGLAAPALIGRGAVGGGRFVAATPMPLGLRSIAAGQLATDARIKRFDGLNERQADGTDVRATAWWQALDKDDLPQFGFRDELASMIDRDGLRLSLVHGDLGSHNVLRDGQRLWLFDWERASFDGPRWTDRVCLWLFRNRAVIAQGREAVCAALLNAMSNSGPSRCDIVAALAYMSATRTINWSTT